MTTTTHPDRMDGQAIHPHGDLIDEYLEHLRQIRRSPKTIATYGRTLWAAHRELPNGLPLAHERELRAWLANPGWAAATQQQRTHTFRGFFAWCRREHLDLDPAAEIKPPRRPRRHIRGATQREVDTILARAPRRPSDVWLWSLIAARAGLRAGEISRMRREHVTEDEIYVIGKGAKERVVPADGALWQQLCDLPPGPVAGGVTPDQVSTRAWSVYNRRMQIPISIHQLRKYFAQTLRSAGADLETIRQLLGHETLATTQAYLGESPEMLRAAVALLPPLSSHGEADASTV